MPDSDWLAFKMPLKTEQTIYNRLIAINTQRKTHAWESASAFCTTASRSSQDLWEHSLQAVCRFHFQLHVIGLSRENVADVKGFTMTWYTCIHTCVCMFLHMTRKLCILVVLGLLYPKLKRKWPFLIPMYTCIGVGLYMYLFDFDIEIVSFCRYIKFSDKSNGNK